MANEHKPESVSPSALIQVGGTNFASMRDSSQLASLEASAPAFHRQVLNAIKGSGKVRDTEVAETMFASVKKLSNKITNGVTVKDNVRKTKGIVIQAKAGYTKKSKTPVHRIADRQGNSWLAKETDLKIIF